MVVGSNGSRWWVGGISTRTCCSPKKDSRSEEICAVGFLLKLYLDGGYLSKDCFVVNDNESKQRPCLLPV